MMREDWLEVELGEAFNITYGKGLSTKDLLKEGYPVYGANGVIGFYSNYKYEERQVLISCRGAASGKINISPEKCFITNNSLIVESSSDFISKEYLYFILSGANRSKIVTGSAQPQVTINNANPLIIKLAPLPIQRAIVSKIEALFSDLDNGIANFKKAQEQLKIYRQAVLKKAFEGELTKEWRVKTQCLASQGKAEPLPTAEELLKQIKEERQNHYNQQLEDWKKAVKEWEKNGKKEGKPSKPQTLKELPSLKVDLNKIPAQWNNLSIEYFLSLTKKGMTTGPFGTMLKKSEHKENGIPVLGIENIGEGVFKLPNKIFVSAEKAKELTSFKVDFGDIIISRSGTVGEICALDKHIGLALISTNLIRVSLNNNLINSKYFVYLFQGGGVREQVRKLCTGSTRDFLNQTILTSLNFPICSIQEQTQIIQEIESRLSVCDKVEQSISESLEKAEALRQSILKKAFEGKLLSKAEIEQCKQAADYEPASELLKKIKAEKLAKEQEKKKTTTKKKSKK